MKIYLKELVMQLVDAWKGTYRAQLFLFSWSYPGVWAGVIERNHRYFLCFS